MWKPACRGRLVQTTWVLRPGAATSLATVSAGAQMPREMGMNVRVFAAAALVAALAVVAVGATGASGGSAAQHPDGLAPGRCAVRLAGCRGGGERPVQGPESGLGRQRPVSDVGHAPREVRRDARGRQRPRRHRDGEHGDDEVHGGGGVPGSVVELVPEPEHVAAGPRRLRPLRREDLRRSVLRGLARRDLPHRPVQARCTPRCRRASRSSPRWRSASARRTRRARSPRSTSREPTGTSR